MNNGNDLVRIGAMIRLFDEWTVSTNSDGISFLFFFFFLLQKFVFLAKFGIIWRRGGTLFRASVPDTEQGRTWKLARAPESR